jgi:hypothetical protein
MRKSVHQSQIGISRRLRKGCACEGSTAPRPVRRHGLARLMQSSWPLPRRLQLTTDDDFFALASRQSHAGMICWHQEKRIIGEAIRRLVRLWEQCLAEALCGRITFSLRRGSSAVWLSTRVCPLDLRGQDTRPCHRLQADHVVTRCLA